MLCHRQASVSSERQCQTYAVLFDVSQACPLLSTLEVDQTSQLPLSDCVFNVTFAGARADLSRGPSLNCFHSAKQGTVL